MRPNRKTLKASELISVLVQAISEHGDLPVYLDDPDTGWLLGVNINTDTKRRLEDYPQYDEVFTIVASYHND